MTAVFLGLHLSHPSSKDLPNIGALSADPHGQKQWPYCSGLPLPLLTNIHIENYTSKYVQIHDNNNILQTEERFVFSPH